jgi:hypothetical protein
VKSEHVHNELALQAGGLLMVYSLSGTAVKSYYQYKNNTVAADAACVEGAEAVAGN